MHKRYYSADFEEVSFHERQLSGYDLRQPLGAESDLPENRQQENRNSVLQLEGI